MQILKGKNIYLRALEPEDIDFLYTVENNTSFWEVSSTLVPFSRYFLKRYIANAQQDIYIAKQLRLVIMESCTNNAIGMIDLFDFSAEHKRAGVGIIIVEQKQQKGFASEALQLLIDYSFKQLGLHQLFANITSDNTKSLKLFSNHHFIKVGEKKEWIYTNGNYKDEILFQLINTNK